MGEPRDEPKWWKVNRPVASVKTGVLFIISCGLLVFVATRSSYHWYVVLYFKQSHQLWVASGSLLQNIWDYTYAELFNRNDLLFTVAGTTLFTAVVFWLSNLLFISLDILGFPSFLLKYKVQDEQKVDLSQFLKALRRVIFNEFVLGVPFTICMYYIMKLRDCDIGGELPTLTWAILDIFVSALVQEIFFYYSHRLLHHPRLYTRIHATHHEWIAPTSISATYTHPVDHLVGTLLPATLGPVILGSHLATAWLWFAVALMSTTVAHSGYHLPLFPSPEAHDYHHLKLNNCFGLLGILDHLHGTDLQFRTSKQYQRNMILLGSVPMNQQVPDSPNKKPR